MSTITFGGPDLQRQRANATSLGMAAVIPSASSIRVEKKVTGSTLGSDDTVILTLEERIRETWASRLKKVERTKAARRDVQRETQKLEQDLANYKAVLAKTGRDGKWSQFLREVAMPKATADRYVHRYEARNDAQGPGKLLTEELSEPKVMALARRYSGLLVKKLRSVEQRQIFLRLLTTELVPSAEPSFEAESHKPSVIGGGQKSGRSPEPGALDATTAIQPFTERRD